MKKIVSLILVLLIMLGSASVNALAISDEESFENIVSSTENIKLLRKKFTVKKLNGGNCACYSPVKGEGDTTKYPLIIFLHGLGHEFGFLSKSDMPYWASEELQAKFTAGGAHILLPQIFHIAYSASKIQGEINAYIKANSDSIDMNRIVIMGSSLGGAKALKLLANAEPDYYCAALISCPAGSPSASKLACASGTPIWLISSKWDLLTGRHENLWEKIVKTTKVPEKCRWMYFDGSVHGPDGKFKISHSLAKIITYDGSLLNKSSYADIYDYVSTVNGNEEKVAVTWENGIIDWINNIDATDNGDDGDTPAQENVTNPENSEDRP